MNKLVSVIKGLRKWSIMAVIITIGVILLVNGMLSGIEFVTLVKGVGVAFMASNAIENAGDVIKKVVTKKIKGQKEDLSED
jgi:hypothetical protein